MKKNIFKWASRDGRAGTPFQPNPNQIYFHRELNQIMLIEGNWYSGGRAYYQYRTFDDLEHICRTILQNDFHELREKEVIVRIAINSVEMERLY